MRRNMSTLRKLVPVIGLVMAAVTGGGAYAQSDRDRKEPIVIDRTGGFEAGGKVITNPNNPAQTLSCDHGYMEYFIPMSARTTNLVMWHSSSTQVWENRWDGGEGFKSMFLRRGYPVYLWDGPRVGRANWSCEPIDYRPAYRDQGNFAAWKFGPSYPNWYPGVQFPTENKAAWEQATRARYDEFDTLYNIQLETDAAAVAADRIGPIVYLTNSAGGLRAQVTVIKSKTDNIKGIVAYESIGFVFPDDAGVKAGTGGFGPIIVPLEDFKKLAKVAIQYVWGDNRPETDSYVKWSRQSASLINQYGGHAEVLMLAQDAGLKGSTHIPFADMDNDKVADLLDAFLKKHQLDGYQGKPRGHWRWEE
jgi:hypothetical protein